MKRTLKVGGNAPTSFRRLRGERGSTLVEFAFVFMILVTMILGIIEFSRALYAYHYVSNAARSATRWAAVNGADCGVPPLGDNSCNGTDGMNSGPASSTNIQDYVTSRAPAGIDASQITPTASWPVNADSPTVCSTTQNAPGCTVQVQVSYKFNFLIPFIRKSAITLSSTSQMIISH